MQHFIPNIMPRTFFPNEFLKLFVYYFVFFVTLLFKLAGYCCTIIRLFLSNIRHIKSYAYWTCVCIQTKSSCSLLRQNHGHSFNNVGWVLKKKYLKILKSLLFWTYAKYNWIERLKPARIKWSHTSKRHIKDTKKYCRVHLLNPATCLHNNTCFLRSVCNEWRCEFLGGYHVWPLKKNSFNCEI